MFGLMKHGPRLPYCGTCKSLGAMYGQRSRLLLNHDVAFLAEVLLDLAGAPLTGAAYRSFNCLTLSKRREEIPAVMQYAAAVTVALAYFRIADHRRDIRPGRDGGRAEVAWTLAGRAFNHAYSRAAKDLRACGFPLDEMAAILETQPEREAHAKSFADGAEPTRISTAIVFSHGVRLAGREDRVEDAWRLGYKFGELIYLLDAFEDRERDKRNGDFNPLLAFPEALSATKARDELLALVSYLEREMAPTHAERLRVNVEERLGLRPRVLQCSCHQTRRTLRDRVRDALAFARALRDRENAGRVKGAFILASAGAVAFVFPDHARRTGSWQQCLGVSMNLMALSAMFAGAPPLPPSSPPPPPGAPPPNVPPDEPMQFRRARPDMPGVNIGNFRGRGCGGCGSDCAGECVGSLIESACDSACG